MAEAYKKPLPYPGASIRLADVIARVEKLHSLLFNSPDFNLETAKECLKQVHTLQLLINPQANPALFRKFQIAREFCDRLLLKGLVSKDCFVNLFEMLCYLLSASGYELALHSPEKSGLIREYRG